MIFQYYLFLVIASLSELYLFRFNNTDHLISKIFSSILLLIWNIIIVLWVCLIFSTKIIEDGELQFKRRRCIHWFSGLKERRISRFYTLLFFLRRQLFWVLILLFKDIKMIVKVSVYSLMQLVYIVILWFHRPFKYSKELIIDLINEFVYLSLWVMLIHFNTEDVWNSVIQNVYIWIIIGNNVILLIFEIAYYFRCKSNFYFYLDLNSTTDILSYKFKYLLQLYWSIMNKNLSTFFLIIIKKYILMYLVSIFRGKCRLNNRTFSYLKNLVLTMNWNSW